MSLQLILGGSGSGKSHLLYTSVIEEAMQHPEKNYMIIVPEQFTMQTQKDLVRLHPAHGILNIDILSFQRLAYRVFEETGTDQRAVLTETGKNLLLRRVAAQKQELLTVLKSKLDKPGYLSEIKSILSELAQYEISDKDLGEIIRISKEKPQLYYKLKDIHVLYEAFEEFKRDRFMTAEEVLDVFCRAADASKLLKNSEFAFDGFTGFTPSQQKTLEKLMALSPKVTVTVTIDPAEQISGRLQEHEVFYLSKKTIRRLTELAGQSKTRIQEPIILDGTNGRFAHQGQLQTLEQRLFRSGRKQRRTVSAEQNDEISVLTAVNPAGEIREAAEKIYRLVREGNLRYREIAVVAGNLDAYENYIRKYFEEFQIPCFIDQTVHVLLNPCLEFIRGAFSIADTNYAYEGMLRFLRTGFAGMCQEDADRVDNYVLAFGIRGKKAWNTAWTKISRRIDEEEAAYCDSLRECLMERLKPFCQVFMQEKAELRLYAAALYELLSSFEVQRKLEERSREFHENGQEDKAKEYTQIYGVIMRLLDEAVELLGDEVVSRTEFEEIMEAGFSEAKVGLIPPGVDQVQVGDVERTRLNHVKVLFFVGLNDGWIPAQNGGGGIVSEMEREFLQEQGVELAPTARENSYIQRFYLYLILTKPSEHLYLSYCRSSSDGSAMRPSYLISLLRKMFPNLLEEDEERTKTLCEQLTSWSTGMETLSDILRTMRNTLQADDEEKELLAGYLRSPEYSEKAGKLLDAAFMVFEQQMLAGSVARDLYGGVLENSVTRLERFAACAFAHYAAYGLLLSEREEFQVQAVDIGNVFHTVLERYSRKLEQSRYDWFCVPDEFREELTETCVEETVASYGSGVFQDSARSKYTAERMKRILKRTVWALHEQVKAGTFIPANFEVSFSNAEHLQAVNISLGREDRIKLKGRIDRIDICENDEQVYVKVIDYKSGNTTFDLVSMYYGLQLQLVVYLSAAMELEQRIHQNRRIVPAGILYYHMMDPMLDGSHDLTEADIRQELLKQLRLNGIVNSDPEIVNMFDQYFDKKSDIIPVGRKTDGSWTAASSVADGEQLEDLSAFVRKKMQELGRGILDGETGVRPYKQKKADPCGYCEFADFCGFDTRLPGASYRNLKELKKEDIWKQISGDEESEEIDYSDQEMNR